MFALGITATVERPGGTDRFGNPLPPATHTVADCAPAPAGSTEQNFQADTIEWDVDLLGPYAADFQAEDVVTLPGDANRYQVHGKPQRWKHPVTGWEAGSVTRLKAVSG